MANPQILAGIMNPAIAEPVAGFGLGQERRRQRLADEQIGMILNETIGGRFGKLATLDPDRALGLEQALQTRGEARTRSMLGDIQMAAGALEQGVPPQVVAQLLGEKAALLSETGIEPTQYLEAIQGLSSQNPQEVAGAMENIVTLKNMLVSGGVLPDPEAESRGEIRKEVRKSVGDEVKQLSKDEATITTNFKKIRGLGDEIRKGNRTAVAQALVALVKLGDPGSTVREGEMVSALNAENPTAALIGVLNGQNVSADVQEAVLRSIDPLNPNTTDVDALLRTADQLVLGSVPSIQARFTDAQERAQGNLSRSGIRSIFTKGLTDRIGSLSDLVGAQESPTNERPAIVEVDF